LAAKAKLSLEGQGTALRVGAVTVSRPPETEDLVQASVFRLIEQLQDDAPHVSVGRIGVVFRDVERLAALYHREQAEAVDLDLDGDRSYSEAEVQSHFESIWTREALHRASIEATYIAFNVLLQELCARPDRPISIISFCNSQAATAITQPAWWTAVYKLAIYRNRLVAHHDVPRRNASSGDRLSPLPPDSRLLEEAVTQLQDIQARRGCAAAPANSFQLLAYLFDHVPVSFGPTGQTPDRKLVDRLLEHGGLPSPSVAEIEELIDAGFPDAVAISRAARQCYPSSPPT
jgi:hypothetical protein